MRTSVKYALFFFALVAMIGIGLTLFSGDSEARLCVWDGEGADALASNPLNWDMDTAPVPNDDILYDGLHLVNASADDPCTWDLSNNSFDMFTIGAGYSGTITQASDMHITGYSQADGTFTGSVSKWVYCSGDFVKTGGTITPYLCNINLSGDNKDYNSNTLVYYNSIIISGVINQKTDIGINSATLGWNLELKTNSILNITSGKFFYYIDYLGSGELINNGHIIGSGLFVYNIFDDPLINVNNIERLEIKRTSVHTTVVKINTDINSDYLHIYSSHATNTITVDLNGHSLTATTITVGTRGILDCGNGTITCSALTSTSGTIIEDTATWIFNDGAVVTATSGEKFYNVQMKGDCDFVNSVNVTNDLRFINVPVDYDDLDIYLDTVYSVTIPSPYTFGPEITAAAEYTYLPDVQISISQFYEDIEFSIYAYISTNLPVTYNITGTASSWLSYHEGRIVGMPPDIGNYTYTITATHASGSVDVVNGYILVGSLSPAEYSYDQIWGLILWIVITAFMLIGLLLNIPLIQIVAFMGTIGSIVASLRIPEFEVFLMMFALGNSALFFIGMVRYRR